MDDATDGDDNASGYDEKNGHGAGNDDDGQHGVFDENDDSL